MSLRDLRRTVGQFLMIGFAGPTIPAEVRALAREFDLGGVVLFKRNVEEPAQVADLAFEARRLSEATPLWVAVDQEGGRVARLRRAFTEWPPMATLRQGPRHRSGPALRDGAGPRAQRGRHHVRLRPGARRVHQPGQSGDWRPGAQRRPGRGGRVRRRDHPGAAGRRHRGLRQALSRARRHRRRLPPRSAPRRASARAVRARSSGCHSGRAIAAGVASIMVGHLLVPAFDDESPASLSPAVVTGQLRGHARLRRASCCTDDLDMKAISARHQVEHAAVRAIAAGCDIVLACGTDHDQHARVVESHHPRRGAGGTAGLVAGRGPGTASPCQGALPRRPGAEAAVGLDAGPGARHARARGRCRPRWRRSCEPCVDHGALRPGARIAIVAPASPFSREELERGLEELRDLGFEPVVDPRIFERQRYVAGLRAHAGRGAHRCARGSGDRRHHRRTRRIRQRAGAAAASIRRTIVAARQAHHRLQRSDVLAPVRDAGLRPRQLPWPDRRRPAERGRGRLRSRDVPGALTSADAAG